MSSSQQTQRAGAQHSAQWLRCAPQAWAVTRVRTARSGGPYVYRDPCCALRRVVTCGHCRLLQPGGAPPQG